MDIPYYTLDELRALLNEESDKRFGPISSKPVSLANTTHATDSELISTKEACRILACGERTLQRYRASRLVSVIYRGPHRCFYYRDEILSLRDANTRPNRDSK